MNTSMKMVIVLSIVTMFSGGILSYWDGFTAPMIEHHRQEAIKKAVKKVLPEYTSVEEITKDDMILYVGHKEDQTSPVGVAFQIVGSGFQGKIVAMVGVTPMFDKLTGLQVLEQVETPGLGTKIVEDPSNKENKTWFADQFEGVQITGPVNLIKNQKPSNPDEIQAITGATISSRSVVKILNDFIVKARKVYGVEMSQPETAENIGKVSGANGGQK